MEYAQLNEALTEALQVNTHGNVEWDSTHYCPASKLTEDEAIYFRVVPLLVTDAPVIDPITQSVFRNGNEFVDGQWQYKWTIVELDQATVDANIAAKKVSDLAAIRTQARNVIEEVYPVWRQSNVALGMYTSEYADQMRADIALVITESNRLEDLIDAGTPGTPNWPIIGV